MLVNRISIPSDQRTALCFPFLVSVNIALLVFCLAFSFPAHAGAKADTVRAFCESGVRGIGSENQFDITKRGYQAKYCEQISASYHVLTDASKDTAEACSLLENCEFVEKDQPMSSSKYKDENLDCGAYEQAINQVEYEQNALEDSPYTTPGYDGGTVSGRAVGSNTKQFNDLVKSNPNMANSGAFGSVLGLNVLADVVDKVGAQYDNQKQKEREVSQRRSELQSKGAEISKLREEKKGCIAKVNKAKELRSSDERKAEDKRRNKERQATAKIAEKQKAAEATAKRSADLSRIDDIMGSGSGDGGRSVNSGKPAPADSGGDIGFSDLLDVQPVSGRSGGGKR
jgi:hypothetical protein